MERLRKLRRTVAMLIVFSIVVNFASMGLTNEVKALAPYIAFYDTRSMTYTVWNGTLAEPGPAGRWGFGMTGFRVSIPGVPSGASIRYQGHVATQGWTGIQSNGANLETSVAFFTSLRIWLVAMPGWDVYFKVNRVNIGWTDWVIGSTTAQAGVPTSGNAIDAVKIMVVPSDTYEDEAGLTTRTVTLRCLGVVATDFWWQSRANSAATMWNNSGAGVSVSVTNTGNSPHTVALSALPGPWLGVIHIYATSSGVITSSDMLISENRIAAIFGPAVGTPNGESARASVTAHEVAHLFRLDDNSQSNSLMGPNAVLSVRAPASYDVTNINNYYNLP